MGWVWMDGPAGSVAREKHRALTGWPRVRACLRMSGEDSRLAEVSCGRLIRHRFSLFKVEYLLQLKNGESTICCDTSTYLIPAKWPVRCVHVVLKELCRSFTFARSVDCHLT
jgi:hypothetical protein